MHPESSELHRGGAWGGVSTFGWIRRVALRSSRVHSRDIADFEGDAKLVDEGGQTGRGMGADACREEAADRNGR